MIRIRQSCKRQTHELMGGDTAKNSQLRHCLVHAAQFTAARTVGVQCSFEQTGTFAGKVMHVDRQDCCYTHVSVSKVLQRRQRETHTHLRCSTCEGDVEGGGHALVRPARKVHQLHAEAAAEPHDIGRL